MIWERIAAVRLESGLRKLHNLPDDFCRHFGERWSKERFRIDLLIFIENASNWTFGGIMG